MQNLGGWLTTVVARVCLDMLRSRRSRGEELGVSLDERPSEANPEAELTLAESIGPALLIVLETLEPAERVAFVLHDLFDLSFEELALIVERTPAATRQLASRARRRVRGGSVPEADVGRQREVVSAFLEAARGGDMARLMAILSPEVVLRADGLAVRVAAARQSRGAPSLAPEVRGSAQVAEAFKARAHGALLADIDGAAGAVWALGNRVRAAFLFTIEGGQVAQIELVMEPHRLSELDVTIAETM